MVADLILYNLYAVTFSGSSTTVDLIAIKDNKFMYVGSSAELGLLKGPGTRLMDCGGGLAVPGFNDAHCHVVAFAATRIYADCSGARSIADLKDVLRKNASEIKSRQWLRASQCDFSSLAEGRFPNRHDLDTAVATVPTQLLDRTGQHCVLNSLALELCGLTVSGQYSAMGGDLIDGVISGDNEIAARAIPQLTEKEMEQGLRQANCEYLSHGITSLQDTSWTNGARHWNALKQFKDRGLLAPRITLLPGYDSLEEFRASGLVTGCGDDQIRLGAVKIALDESTGELFPAQHDLDRIALKAHNAGFQLAFHVAGTYLLQASLRTLDYICDETGMPCIRPRFEHCPVCPPTLLPRLAASGAVVVTQPNLFYETGRSYLEKFSSTDLESVFPFKSYLARGIPTAFSSDSPLTPCDPLPAIRAAVTRRVAGGAVLGQEERITVADALRMYTYMGAYSSRDEQVKGSIAAGMLADLVILDGNPVCDGEESLDKAQVVATLIDGKVVWER